MQLLALGDSYTIGDSVDASERWPVQLTEALRTIGFDMRPPRIIAQTAWTTSDLHQGIVCAKLDAGFDLVTLLIGVNNQYRGLDAEHFADEFESLLSLAIEFAGGKAQAVLALSIPDYGETPFAKDKQFDASEITAKLAGFNAIVASIAHKLGVQWIDVASKFRVARHRPEMLADDGLHPSGQMYAVWVQEILPTACQVLNSADERV